MYKDCLLYTSRKLFADSLGATQDNLIGGNFVTINEKAGVYAKNDEICVNTDILFDTLDISGKVSSDFSYKLKATKTCLLYTSRCV